MKGKQQLTILNIGLPEQISAAHAADLIIACLICVVDFTIQLFGHIKMDGVVL
jgi:hypothetical protein